MRFLLPCALATCLAAQQDFSADDAGSLLLKVRGSIMHTLNRLPKYLCTETIDRSISEPDGDVTGVSCEDLAKRRQEPAWSMRRSSSDRVRLDVAVSGDSEMYSWAGEDRFHQRALADLVRGGTSSTGAFASFLRAIFGSDAATFSYNGSVISDNRALLEYGFTVPLELSGYRVGNGRYSAIVPYDGTFLIDPKTAELVRLIVRATELPAELQTCEDRTTLNYGHVQFPNVNSLLPNEATLQVFYVNGSEAVNRTVFSGCHEYHGESSIDFGDTPTAPVAAPSAAKLAAFPANCKFRLALTLAIDTATAAAGDLVRAHLVSPIKGARNLVILEKGAPVTGRIVQIKKSYGLASTSLILAIRLETIQVDGVSIPFRARLESRLRKTIRSNDVREAARTLGSFDQIAAQSDENAAILEFADVSSSYVISPGFEIDGVTLAH